MMGRLKGAEDKVLVSVNLNVGLLREIDELRAKFGLSRSAFIRLGLKWFIEDSDSMGDSGEDDERRNDELEIVEPQLRLDEYLELCGVLE